MNQKNLLKGKRKIKFLSLSFSLIFIFLFYFSFVSSLDLSEDLDTAKFGVSIVPDTTSVVNYSTINVNNSQFLQGLTPQQVADLFSSPYLYNQTDPLPFQTTTKSIYNDTQGVNFTMGNTTVNLNYDGETGFLKVNGSSTTTTKVLEIADRSSPLVSVGRVGGVPALQFGTGSGRIRLLGTANRDVEFATSIEHGNFIFRSLNGTVFQYYDFIADTTTNKVFFDLIQGRVGIGTTLPQATLHVYNTSTTPFQTAVIEGISTKNAYDSVLVITGGNKTDEAGVGSGIKFSSRVSGGSDIARGSIQVMKESATDNANSYMSFGTRNTTLGMTEKIRITNGGYIGIGTPSPLSLLHLNSTTGTTPTITITEGNIQVARLGDTTAGGVGGRLEINNNTGITHYIDSSFVSFGTDVGIKNVPSGTYELEVTGSIQADDYYSSDGTIGFTGTCASTEDAEYKNGIMVSCGV